MKMPGQKRRLSDILDSEWSKEELSRFYRAYRKYGKNWRKVAGAIRSKSSGMVENLYNQNKAFLSLPEAQGTADAFIAMMTDRHNTMDIHENEWDNNDALKTNHKPKKRSYGKLRLDVVKDSDRSPRNYLQIYSNASCYGPMPVMKKNYSGDMLDRIRQHPVKKRTPRIPVQYSHDTNNKDSNILRDEEVLRFEVNSSVGARQASTGLVKTGGSPKAVGALSRRTYDNGFSPHMSFEKKYVESDLASTEYFHVGMDVNYSEDSSGNMEEGNVRSTRDAILLDSEDYGINESKWNGKFQKERFTISDSEFDQNKYAREACSDVVEGELCSLDNLHTLADLALRTADSESSLHANLDRRNLDTAQESNLPTSASMNHENDRSQRSATHWKAFSTEKYKIPRRKRNSLQEIPKSKNDRGSNPGEDRQNEVLDEDENTSFGELLPPPKGAQLDRSVECVSLKSHPGTNNLDPTRPTLPDSSLCLPAKTCSRRKMGLQNAFVQKGMASINAGEGFFSKDSCSVHNKTDTVKRQLSNCLSSQKLRKWCMYEWFYGAIDYPWFAKDEFVTYLKHLGLGNMSSLRRVEWVTIRSSLGKPRRFSRNFLLEERKKLERYRESVRTCYGELSSGVREVLPRDLARPLSVGQHVITCHPKSGEILDGTILTVHHNRFDVQFADSDLGVQSVMDVNCMPLNPQENLPVDLKNQNSLDDELGNSGGGKYPYAYGHLLGLKLGYSFKSLDIAEQSYPIASSEHPLTTMTNHEKIQAEDADIRALVEMRIALDKKEALVRELSYMNEVLREKSGDTIEDVEQFKKLYTMVVMELSAVELQVAPGLCYLRERCTYHENSRAAWFSLEKLSASHALATYDLEQAIGIVGSSRREAKTIVEATFQIGEIDTASSEIKELISDCLATCLMIQTCANGEQPPTVVAETLRRALASLKPCCPDNLRIYEEIEKSVTALKYVMISRIPENNAGISV